MPLQNASSAKLPATVPNYVYVVSTEIPASISGSYLRTAFLTKDNAIRYAYRMMERSTFQWSVDGADRWKTWVPMRNTQYRRKLRIDKVVFEPDIEPQLDSEDTHLAPMVLGRDYF